MVWGLGFRGYPFGGTHNKDYSISGSILGFPYFGKLLHRVVSEGLYTSRGKGPQYSKNISLTYITTSCGTESRTFP